MDLRQPLCIVLASCVCCNKLPQTWGLKTTGLFSHKSGDWKAKMNITWAKIKPLEVPGEHPGLFPFLVAAGILELMSV